MFDVLYWLFVAFAGSALGLFYFGGLWYTLKYLERWKNPAIGMSLSMFFRSGVVVLGLYALTGGQWKPLVVALIGFIGVRIMLVRYFGPVKKTHAILQ